MKKLILICGLLASGASFGANWNIYAVSSDDNQISTYDRDSVRKIKPNIYKVWTNTTSKKPPLNTKINNYIDCNDETLILADAYIYQDGALLNSFRNQVEKNSIPPESVAWNLLQIICKTKAP